MMRYFLDGKGPLLVQQAAKSKKGEHRPRASVFFTLGGKIYNVELLFPRLPIQEITPKVQEEVRKLQKEKKFKEVKPGDISFEKFQDESRTGHE